MIRLVNLKTKIITLNDFETIQQFQCGNTSIERFLKQEAYYLTIVKECSTTLVFDDAELIGFFSLRKATLQIDEDGKLIDFPCLDIARIATSISKQSNGYGSAILQKIYQIAHTVNERFLTLEALIERYEWYKGRGFNPLIEDETINSNEEGLIFMVADLYDEDLVNQYFEE